MLNRDEISRIIQEVAKKNLPGGLIDHVINEPTVDSQGEDALRVTIVIAPGAAEKLPDEGSLDMLLEIHDRLREAGEDRLPIVEYATEEELARSGDD